MRRVDRVRLEKRRRVVVTFGLAFTLGALTTGWLNWRADRIAAEPFQQAIVETPAVGPTVGATSAAPGTAPAATSGTADGGDTARGPAEAGPHGMTVGPARAGAHEILRSRALEVPVDGVSRGQLRDSFDERRGGGLRRHEAIDIMAPRGTPVRAVEKSSVVKLFRSVQGGLTVYLFDAGEMFCYYYAHLDRYAAGLKEGQQLRRGEVIGYVGSTGNASEDAPHLHFAVFQLDADRKWWQGTPINPYHVFK